VTRQRCHDDTSSLYRSPAKDAAVFFDVPPLHLAGITAPAIAIALSPIPVVIALVLLVHNERPRTASIAYLAARVTALALLPAALLGAPRLGASVHRPPPAWTHWAAVAVALAFIAFGIRMWSRRKVVAASSAALHSKVGGIPPSASAALGLFPPLVNPKVMAASLAADSQIADLPSALGTAAALAWYVAVASSTVAAPVVVYLALGSRIDPKLDHLRRRIQLHSNAVAAVTLIFVGAMILLYVTR
jgi:hypothetical protein